MQFRCYSCGLVFSEGMPPIEALSTEQLAIVTGEGPTVQHDLLFGTKFEGMSTAGFCVFCLTAIRDFPMAIEEKHSTPGHKMEIKAFQGVDGVFCECGDRWDRTEKAGRFVYENRWMVRHLIDILYTGADTTEIDRYINLSV